MSKRSSIFNTIRTEGAILPAELLQRIVSGDSTLEGLKSTDYHLSTSERLNEAATRSWNRLIGVWQTYKEILNQLPDEAIGTTETRERWLLPLFQELGYGRLQTQKSIEIEDKTYPISHKASEPVAIHLVSFKWDLDKRNPIAKGETKLSPHSLMQEFLNRSEDHLWGILSNGLKLRILRDNVSLTRAAYVEFDLQAMMDGVAYSDFFLLYLLCHQSRVEVKTDETGRVLPPETCWLEKWYNASIKDGVRALDELRNNVQSAIESLGAGFLCHTANTDLRDKLRSGTLTLQDYYHQVLLQVYRLLFVFVAEDRDLLIPGDVPDTVKQTYHKYYSTYRIRELARKKRGTRHSDLWQQLNLLFNGLYDGNTALGLPALGSFLFRSSSTQEMANCEIANSDLLSAVRYLCYTQKNNIFQPINYRNLGPEELGSVYESLLEMHPEINLEAGYFKLNVVSGSERKTTGSYYTPSSLVNCLLDSALEPVIERAVSGKVVSSEGVSSKWQAESGNRPADPLTTHHSPLTAEQAILALKICDPACGSGHFLISAAHRLAKRLASIRAGEDEPAPSVIQHALRDVIGHCIYGVDMNPMAVELCKISLWMEALEPGKPLTFLDHHIQCGNSLLGCTPALLQKGIPNAAFTPLTGDDKDYCNKYKKLNKEERDKDVLDIFSGDEKPWEHLGNHVPYQINLNQMDDTSIENLKRKEEAYAEIMRSSGYLNSKFIYDAWCAAFVWKKAPSDTLPYPITQRLLDNIDSNPYSVNPAIRSEIMRLADEYKFFHWHIAFPDVFVAKMPTEISDQDVTGWTSGFDCILGNPPWGASVSDKQKLLIQNSYHTTEKGIIDTFSVFTELSVKRLVSKGYLGLVLPDVVLLKNYPSIRLYLLLETTIIEIANWGRAFKNVNIDVCTIVCQNCQLKIANNPILAIPSVINENPRLSTANAITQSTFLSLKDYKFNLTLNHELLDNINSFRSNGRFIKELFIVREGVHSGNVRSKLFLDSPLGDKTKPLIVSGSEISPMQVTWGGRYIQLNPDYFDANIGEYYNIGNASLHESPKIIVRRTGDFILAAVDSVGYYCSNNYFLCVPKLSIDWNIVFYICAYLNSRFATWYFRTIQPRTGKLFAELKITHLEEIPILFTDDIWAEDTGRRFRIMLDKTTDKESMKIALNEFNDELERRLSELSQNIVSLIREVE